MGGEAPDANYDDVTRMRRKREKHRRLVSGQNLRTVHRVNVNQHSLLLRNVLITVTLVSALAVAVYVSVPDFPVRDKPWQIELWSDPSGWWSEISWIIAFAGFVTTALLFRSWFYALRPSGALILRTRLGVFVTIASWEIAAAGFLIYFKPVWPGLYEYFVLDRTGTLHGLFYLSTAHLGVIALIFGLALVARIVSIASEKV